MDSYISRDELAKTFKGRIKTQDRDGRLPMRVVALFLSRNKDWIDELTTYVSKIKFIIDEKGTKVCLKKVEKLCLGKNKNGIVMIQLTNGSSYQLFTEVFDRRKTIDKDLLLYVPLKTNSLRDLTLDHSFPISCIMELGKTPFLEKLNKDYCNFIVKNSEMLQGKPLSKVATLFCEEYKQMFNPLDILKDIKTLFSIGELVIMKSNYNTAKRNSFIYCKRYPKCKYSIFSKYVNDISKSKNGV